ncbi:putative v-type c subunit family protein [Golovinomyces cichoracearum]|uniref:Putative v-type c subunit family protein n=1 Tax=Golovinomyces cichoracearum TaxID=62708 RepID=A0A420J5V9_9PEZI|nr:putative v-type c subunit family protein [Golovinomyces cichoracearum]
MIRRLNFLSVRFFAALKNKSCPSTPCFKISHSIGSAKLYLNTKAHKESHVDLPFNYSELAESSKCVSLRFSKNTDGKYLPREIIGYLKPYIMKTVGTVRKDNKSQSLVIFATPAHLAWLENDSVRKYLIELFKDHSHATPLIVDVICACIDGLPPSGEELRLGKRNGFHEGVSMYWDASTPDLWPLSPSLIARVDDKCSFTFQYNNCNDKHSYQVTMPLANTIFENGRRSTLTVAKWQISQNSIRIIEGPTYRVNASVYTSSPNKFCSLQVPVKSLTPFRIIENGFGNIVRRLRIKGQGSFPASHELERAVTKAYQQNIQGSDQGVWALIIPSNLLDEKNNYHGTNLNINSCQELDACYIEDLIREGAKICRVLSGGGGWGVKEGLLALDPVSVFDESSDSHYETTTKDISNQEDQQAINLGNMAQNGALIQFLQKSERSELISFPTRTDLGGIETVVGSFKMESCALAADQDLGHLFIPGLFGCVSESGMFLRSLGVSSTKIDVPSSYIYAG